MADFDPDAFIKKYGGDEEPPSESTFATKGSAIGRGVAKFTAGVPRGLAGAGAAVLPYLPTSPLISKRYDPLKKMREYGEGGDQEGPEAWGKFTGEMLPTLIPGLGEVGAGTNVVREARGIGILLRPGVKASETSLAKTIDAGVQGAVGGVMAPRRDEKDANRNIGVGAATGIGLGATKEALAAIPGKYRWLLNIVPAGIAMKILHGLGLPEYLAIPALGLGFAHGRIGLGGSGLGDLATQGVSKIPPRAAGNIAARTRPAEDEDDGR